ncbi:hypothetical protein COW36_17545 [bacterium (Candidatus Blackallbacteria) CG17_big_fil_post_rev_8_21_14_2_50_48_46]|uniref:histidine kinase n=1 Tax=bacterium (Candidatus Blackallbacteria) CG17_big_fil_post_rev_8_21_14_2_50_48_46 TaxID=2014261 RepID=A0A2M7G0S1_9BACT|nr:MAG: hypothetical protein COW64_01185 [bacterium (Candidatus Blackallbacteria) CG18_big_fil_WC_8_21_14_2_50_49_26]PIW15226.1 MAG: hypothetical protein COW36_17545 [bacterium (Candidatus Blackallbacteria) CG17_big_fil_post_rev_8_21_14_2_50_48_46]PIW44813.1 MAG: hypothetical protein COW20_22880 [bacterium (Candidatus Blackallbacteria) CG13_big_fil_rev_8_21_14_2_50_49_14]
MQEGPLPAQLYQVLFSQILMPLMLTDRAFSHFLDLNQAAARLLGLPSAEIFNLSPNQCLPDIHADLDFQNPFQSLLRTAQGNLQIMVYPSVLKEYLCLALLPLTEEQQLQADNQRLQNLSQRKSELIANLSHEIRTPLTAILGWPEILIDYPGLPDRVYQAAQAIEKEGQLVYALVEDLMDLSKIEAGQMRLDIRAENLSEVIRNAVEMLIEKANEKKQILELDLPETDLIAEMDPLRITQVLLNLLTNALKFTPEKGHIQVAARLEENEILIWIRDTGVGLRKEDHALIFQRFQRAVDAEAFDGAGIGLSLVQKFVELHGGRIGVESEHGKGSTFWFTLPVS